MAWGVLLLSSYIPALSERLPDHVVNSFFEIIPVCSIIHSQKEQFVMLKCILGV